MLARPANYFEDSSKDAREVLGIEDLQKRLNFMARVVYPAIFDIASKGKDEETKRFIKNKLIVTTEFHPGAIVMIKNDLRTSKAEVRNEGPFEVARRTRGGSYEIKGPDGSLNRRAPSQMKLVYQEPVTVSKPAPDEESIIEMEINKIINHRVIDGKTSHLIHWKKLSSELDQWVSEEDINGLDAIRLYVKSLKSHSKPSKRKRRAWILLTRKILMNCVIYYWFDFYIKTRDHLQNARHVLDSLAWTPSRGPSSTLAITIMYLFIGVFPFPLDLSFPYFSWNLILYKTHPAIEERVMLDIQGPLALDIQP